MKKFSLYISFMLLLVSCVKHGGDGSSQSLLVIDAEISSTASSKAIIEGTSFKTGNTIGLFVYHSEARDAGNPSEMSNFSLYGARYRNIWAVYDANNSAKPWRFRFEGATTSFDDIYLLRPTVEAFEVGLSVVAYSPWIKEVPSITEIPFALGGQSEDMTDLMWARQNTHDKDINPIDPGINYKIIPDGNAEYVKFTFQHALSLIRIGFRCKHQGSAMTVSSVTLRRKDGAQTMLPVAGKFNAMDGSIVEPVNQSHLTYDYTDHTYSFQSTAEYVYVPMLICPQEYKADGDYILEFRFNGHDIASKYEIRLADVAGGFKAGEVYTFDFTVDNYIQFDGVSVSSEWIELDGNKAELRF